MFLHGYPLSSWELHKVWDGLSARHMVVAPDFLGYGFSSKPEGYPYSVADHADMVEALVAREGLGGVRLVAHDVGVLVAAELVSRAQDGMLGFDVRSVVLLNGTLFSADRRPSFAQELLGGVFGGLVNDLPSEGSFVDNLAALTGPDAPDLRPEFTASWGLLNDGSGRIMHKLLHTVRDRRVNEARRACARRRCRSGSSSARTTRPPPGA